MPRARRAGRCASTACRSRTGRHARCMSGSPAITRRSPFTPMGAASTSPPGMGPTSCGSSRDGRPRCRRALDEPDRMTGSLLVVDDDAVVREALVEALVEAGYEVRGADDGARAVALLAERAPDVVLSDVRMPGMDGLALLALLRERAPDVPVLLMTAYDDMPTVVAAMREGATDFLVKPLDLHELRARVARVIDDRRARARAAHGRRG